MRACGRNGLGVQPHHGRRFAAENFHGCGPVGGEVALPALTVRRFNRHEGGVGKVVQLTDKEEKTAIKAAKSMGLSICGVDMMRSSQGPLVLEVNASPGFGIETVTDRNVAGKIIEYIEQNARGKHRRDKIGA